MDCDGNFLSDDDYSDDDGEDSFEEDMDVEDEGEYEDLEEAERGRKQLARRFTRMPPSYTARPRSA
jgi:hypothetical protein